MLGRVFLTADETSAVRRPYQLAAGFHGRVRRSGGPAGLAGGLSDAAPESKGAVIHEIESDLLGVRRSARQSAEDFAGNERFLVQRRLGAGAFGVVYEAFDRREGSRVALKVLRFAEADSLYRFKKDFRSLADLRHPNLVALYELMSEDGLWMFSMELVPGVDFIAALAGEEAGPTIGAESDVAVHPSSVEVPAVAGRARPDYDRVRRILLQLARGLHTVHLSGKVHRDIKPPNVLVTHDDRAVLLDFGLVTELQRIGIPEIEPQTVGTPAYMSPEQALALPGTAASDWYSVGVMLYQALSGELPFHGTAVEIMASKQTGLPAALPDAPADLGELCLGLLDPDPETRLPGEEVLRRLEVADHPPAARIRQMREHVEVPFVGRKEVLAELEDALDRCRHGTVAVYLSGASGMGKTALLDRFVTRQVGTDEQTVVLTGRCYLQESVPYKALDSLIDSLSRYLASLPREDVAALIPPGVASLSRLFPVLLRIDRVAAAQSEPLEPRLLRRRAFAVLRELLGRLAERRRLVLVLDDLQWGDMDSFQVLDELFKPPDPPPLLLIGAYRSEDQPASRFLRALADHRRALSWHGVDVRELEIGELSTSEASGLIRGLERQGVEIPAERARKILSEAGGNPLFLSELAHFSTHRESAIASTEVGERPSGSDLRLRDVISSRVTGLPASARRLLEIVAVAGKPLEWEAARLAAELGAEGTEAIARLRTQKLIRQSAGEDREQIECYHDRIREVVVAGLSPRSLRAGHGALALALESSGRADPETLAVHFQATEEVVRAREYAVTAAARAEQALAFDRAARLYRQALDLVEDDGPERYRLEVQLGEALANAGHSREAAETFLQAVGHSGAINPVEAQRHAAEKLLISGHIDRGMAILRHVLRTTGMRLEKRSWKALADLWWHRLRLRLRGLRFSETPASACDPQQLRKIDACWSVEIGLCLVDVLRASQFHSRHLLLALEAGEPQRVARGLAMEVFFGSMEGAATGEVLEQARSLAGRVRGRYASSLTEMAAGMLACSRGAWREARQSLEKAENQLREARAGVVWELDTVRHFRILAELQLGSWPRLFAELPDLLGPALEQGNLFLATHLRHWVESLRHLVGDRPEDAQAVLGDSIRDWSQEGFHFQHFGHLHASAQVALYRGRGTEAWKLVSGRWSELKDSMIQRIEMVLILSHDLGARCALAAAAESDDPSLRSWLLHRAVRSARRIGRAESAWSSALADLLHSGVAAARGRHSTALARLRAAAAGFDQCEMVVHAAACRRRLGRLTGDAEAVAAAEQVLRERGVGAPDRMSAVLAPGGRDVGGLT